MKKEKMTGNACIAVAIAVLFVSGVAQAQESANDELNSCVKKEQVLTTAKGAGIGAITGLTAMLVTHKNADAGKAAVIGAVAGGVAGGIAGFATAYYTAIDTCYKKNPSWIPESNIQRTRDYDNVKKQIHYRASQGIVTRVESVNVVGPVKAAGQAEVDSTFIVMTPNGAETPVTVERKLFVAGDDGNETEVKFPGQTSERHTFEPGEQTDVVRIPVPPDAKAGTVYRVQFSVAADEKAPVVASQKFSIVQ